MTDYWALINDDAYKQWIQSVPIPAAEFNALSVQERVGIKRQFDELQQQQQQPHLQLQQIHRLNELSLESPPPMVACRLWTGEKTVYRLPAPSFDAFDAKVRSVFDFGVADKISFYYVADKTMVNSRKYISNDHDLNNFLLLAGKPTLFIWIRGDPSLSPGSLPSEVEIQAMSIESISESSGSTQGYAQKLFRRGVRARDKDACVLSGTKVREKTNNVQAAHIFGVEKGLAEERERAGIYNSYDTQNGMLLETSLHADFDSYLWCMDEFLIVHVSEKGRTKGLGKWHGKKVNIKFGQYGSPTPDVMRARYTLFLKKQDQHPPPRIGRQGLARPLTV
jgi:hypothetical protein